MKEYACSNCGELLARWRENGEFFLSIASSARPNKGRIEITCPECGNKVILSPEDFVSTETEVFNGFFALLGKICWNYEKKKIGGR